MQIFLQDSHTAFDSESSCCDFCHPTAAAAAVAADGEAAAEEAVAAEAGDAVVAAVAAGAVGDAAGPGDESEL